VGKCSGTGFNATAMKTRPFSFGQTLWSLPRIF
jgi:hypothetical protein